MAKKKFERQCTICSSSYQYCPNCSDFDRSPRWMNTFCSERCKTLYNITAGFINHWLEPEVEAARLSELTFDKEYVEKLPDWMKDAIAELQRIDTTNAKAITSALKDEEPEIKPQFGKTSHEEIKELSKNDKIIEQNKSSDGIKNNGYQNKKIKPKFAAK